MKKYVGKKLKVISFRRNNGEIGMHLNLKSELSPILIQDAFVCSSYIDCVEYHYCNPEKLIIEILEVNKFNQITKCVIAGNDKQIESFLIANGEATPDNPINFTLTNLPEELSMAMGRLEMTVDDVVRKLEVNDSEDEFDYLTPEELKEVEPEAQDTANDRLNDVEFYDLMQHYRMARMEDQDSVVKRFEEVKEWIKQNYA